MKRILLIDGNYFAHRAIFGMQITNKEISLVSKQEQELFRHELFASLASLVGSFDERQLIHQVIFASDCGSWRKDVVPHKPYYIDKDDKTTPLVYKENRAAKKENDKINWNCFDTVYDNFVEEISTKMITLKVNKLEGDDIIMLVKNYLTVPELEYEFVVFCTDGDLKQTVNDKQMLFSNTRSKENPFGEFIISANKYRELYGNSAIQTLIGNNLEKIEYEKLFSVEIGRPLGRVKRNVTIADPFVVALSKSICGDKKDNIFPIMRWKSTTGTKNLSVVKSHLIKAMELHGMKLDNPTCGKVLSNFLTGDKTLLTNIVLALRDITKQENLDFKSIGTHLKHNMLINILMESNIPAVHVGNFIIELSKIKPLLREKITLDQYNFNKNNVNPNSNTILINSAPQDILDIIS